MLGGGVLTGHAIVVRGCASGGLGGPHMCDASMAKEEEVGRAGRNFIRGALLGIGATVLGVLLGGAPDYLAGTVKLPAILTEPGLLVGAGGGGC